MQLLSELTLVGLQETIGKPVIVADKNHFFHGLRGGVVAIRDTVPSGTAEKPSQVKMITPEVVMSFPLIDGVTGAVSDAQLAAKASQIALEPPKAPYRPRAKKQSAAEIAYTDPA